MSGSADHEVLGLEERGRRAIAQGESHYREFKSGWIGEPGNHRPRPATAICRDVAEALVAFANADGGELLVGVEDSSDITGLTDDDESYISVILRAPETHVHRDTPIAPLTGRLIIDGRLVLYFQVDKGTEVIHLTSDGRCLQRRDRATVPVASEQIRFERQEHLSREFDRGFVVGAHLEDLDTELIQRVARDIPGGGDISAEKCLQLLNLAEFAGGDLRVRRAALLLFANDIERWHPRCEVRVVRVKGTEVRTAPNYNVENFGIVRGNIMALYHKSWEILRTPGLLVETKFSADGLFQERIMYPEDAVREALVNAIAHRDYGTEGRGIEIAVFDDRMEIQSPGAALSTVDMTELRKLTGIHESRNAFISRALREVGYMREMGEGIRRMHYLMKTHDLVPPEIKSDRTTFWVVLHHESVFSEADQRWIDSYEPFNLTKEEKLVVLLGKSGELVSPQQIWETVDLVDTEVYRTIVYGLQVKSILVTDVEKNNANSQARRLGKPLRSIGRFRIRSPQECETDLAELLQGLRSLDPIKIVSNSELQAVVRSLSDRNQFRRSTSMVGGYIAAFKQLGFVDDDRRPASRLIALLKTPAVAKASPETIVATPASSRMARRIDTGSVGLAAGLVPDIFVGNLDYEATSDEVRLLFREYGQVLAVRVPQDYVTGRGRGIAFVTMPDRHEASAAVRELEGVALRGRRLRVGWSRGAKEK